MLNALQNVLYPFYFILKPYTCILLFPLFFRCVAFIKFKIYLKRCIFFVLAFDVPLQIQYRFMRCANQRILFLFTFYLMSQLFQNWGCVHFKNKPLLTIMDSGDRCFLFSLCLLASLLAVLNLHFRAVLVLCVIHSTLCCSLKVHLLNLRVNVKASIMKWSHASIFNVQKTI